MNKLTSTIVNGAIGFIALCAVGGIAFKLGHDVAEMEIAYNQMKEEVESEPDILYANNEPIIVKRNKKEEKKIVKEGLISKLKNVLNHGISIDVNPK